MANVKGSRANTGAAQAAGVMNNVTTGALVWMRANVAVYLNCDAGGTSTLDVAMQTTPDTLTSPVWYQTDTFTQVSTLVSQQVKTPSQLGLWFRCLPTLAGVHNFGLQVTFPVAGFAG